MNHYTQCWTWHKGKREWLECTVCRKRIHHPGCTSKRNKARDCMGCPSPTSESVYHQGHPVRVYHLFNRAHRKIGARCYSMKGARAETRRMEKAGTHVAYWATYVKGELEMTWPRERFI